MGDGWRLTFVPIDTAIAANLRVRGLLKRALRSYGLRCVDMAIVETKPKAKVEAETPRRKRKS